MVTPSNKRERAVARAAFAAGAAYECAKSACFFGPESAEARHDRHWREAAERYPDPKPTRRVLTIQPHDLPSRSRLPVSLRVDPERPDVLQYTYGFSTGQNSPCWNDFLTMLSHSAKSSLYDALREDASTILERVQKARLLLEPNEPEGE